MSAQLLFIALSRKGWGETSLGVEVARQVRSLGGTASFLVHSGGLGALSGTGFEAQEVPDHMGPLFEILLEQLLAASDFDAVVLSDFMTTNYTMGQWGLDPSRLLELPLPLIAIDTWQYELTGGNIDIFGDASWPVAPWIEQVALRLVPVPMGQPASPGAYCSVPEIPKVPRRVRAHVRDTMGFGPSERVVLFCTANWQHTQGDEGARRIAQLVPELLWLYLSQVDQGVHLLHVGPERLSIPAGQRYHWMPSVAPANFDRLLASADMLLSCNVSATTIARAMAMDVPVLVAANPHGIPCGREFPASPRVRSWLERACPLYPFALWPIGYWRFLQPLLADTPYARSLAVVDLLDEEQFLGSCRDLLFDRPIRQAAIDRQEAFVHAARQLPTAAQRIARFLQ